MEEQKENECKNCRTVKDLQEALSAEIELREAFEREVYEHRATLESIKRLAGG